MSDDAFRGPASDYLTDEKQKYRDAVWRTFADLVGPRLLPNAVGLLMPSTSGAEIATALRHGFVEKNLIAVDDNPAIIATAKWRKRYPKVRCYGSEVGRALERIAEDGIAVDVANLDYCGNFSTPTVESVQRVARSTAFQPTAALALTVLRGREDTATVTALRMLQQAKGWEAWDCDMRLDALFHEAGFHQRLVRHGEYKSQTQRMAWAIAARYNVDTEALRRAEALAASGLDIRLMAKLNAWNDDLHKALNGGKPDLRYPYWVGTDGKLRHGYRGYCPPNVEVDHWKTELRARPFCERKLRRVFLLQERFRERVRSHPAADLPCPSRPWHDAPGALTAYASLRGTGARASLFGFLRAGKDWRPFDEWLINRQRLTVSRSVAA